MIKKILLVGIVTSLMLSTSVFATDLSNDEVVPAVPYNLGEDIIQGDIMLISSPEIMPVASIEEVKPIMSISLDDEAIECDFASVIVDGKTMVPLRVTLEALGFDVTWNEETRSIDMMRGAQWSSIKIGENRYSKGRMAHFELTSAPVIVDGSTYVPFEFFVEVFDLNLSLREGKLNFSSSNDPMDYVIHEGFVKEINLDDVENISITITNNLEDDSPMNDIIIHTSLASTIYNADVLVGQSIKVVSPPMMTMSIPAQTSTFLIY